MAWMLNACVTGIWTDPANKERDRGKLSGIAEGVTVPDTLDLSDIARLGLNGISGLIDEEAGYEAFTYAKFDCTDPYLEHSRLTIDCSGKFWESFPYLRSITGSEEGIHIEDGFKRAMLSRVAADGLFYSGIPEMTAWHEYHPPGQNYHSYPIGNEPFASVLGNARIMLAMMAYYQQDGDEVWLDRIKRTSDGLRDVAIMRDDYAYIPDGSIGAAFNYPMSGWRNIDEPSGERYGGEGSVLCYYGQVIRAMVRWNELGNDNDALDLARRLVNFCQRSNMWEWQDMDPSPKDIHAADKGVFLGHYHGHLSYLRGLLEYAELTEDWRLKDIARSGYEYARKKGLSRIGCFGEGCAVADMIALAIRLSDYGMGDYWDDVNQYVRNQFVELQFSDPDKLQSISDQSKPSTPDDPSVPGMRSREKVIERGMGMFSSGGSPTHCSPTAGICCVGNASNAIYYAWESILRFQDGSAQVNLMLNRTSSALDVESYLPYEPKVVIRNRSVKTIAVRIPGWVERSTLEYDINGTTVHPAWIGNYVLFTSLQDPDIITICFAERQETATYRVDPNWWHAYYTPYRPTFTEYLCHFRGDTCISVTSSRPDSWTYPLYDRDNLKQSTAPVKVVKPWIPGMTFRW